MTWTPGPWEISGVERDFSIWGVAKGTEVGNREAICFDVQRIEDARLISLAPEMAELLERFVTGIEEAGPEMVWAIYVSAHEHAARDLLARARGEA